MLLPTQEDNLLPAEQKQEGAVSAKTYLAYFRSFPNLGTALIIIFLFAFCQVGTKSRPPCQFQSMLIVFEKLNITQVDPRRPRGGYSGQDIHGENHCKDYTKKERCAPLPTYRTSSRTFEFSVSYRPEHLKYFWNWFGKAYGGVFKTYSGLARACFVRLTGFPRMSLRDHIQLGFFSKLVMTNLARSEREQLFTSVLPITYFVLKISS